MNLTKDDKSLLDIVHSDLIFLRDEWNNEVDDHTLRRTSPVLRRLLVEQDLHRAWKLSGFENQARFQASTLDPMLNAIPSINISFACAGGASYKGAQLRGLFEYKGKLSKTQREEINLDGFPDREYNLLEFIKSPSMIIQGCDISRRHVIKYVTNKLGGAHLDTSRDKRKDDAIFSLLDIVQNHFTILDKPAVYFELLSIGQAVIHSSDIDKLINKYRSA